MNAQEKKLQEAAQKAASGVGEVIQAISAGFVAKEPYTLIQTLIEELSIQFRKEENNDEFKAACFDAVGALRKLRPYF